MQAITFAPSNPDKVYGGFGVWRCATDADERLCDTPSLVSILTSEDNGRTWTRHEETAVDGLTVTEVIVHPMDADIAWASTAGGGVFHTSDGGTNWESTSNGLRSNMVMDLALDPENPDILYAATVSNGVFKSQDSGTTWIASSGGMDPNEPIGAVVVDPVRTSVVYAGSWSSGVYLSQDGGVTWRRINQGLRTRSVRALAISVDGETLYAATRGEGVFRLSTLNQKEFDELGQEFLAVRPTSTEISAITPQPVAIHTPVAEAGSPVDEETAGGTPCAGGTMPLLLIGFVWLRRRNE